MLEIVPWFIQRASEPSTWAGFAGLAVVFGLKGKKGQDLMKEIEIALEPNPPKPIYFEWKEDARTNWFDFTASDCEIGGVAHRCIQVTSSPSHVLPKDRNYDEEWP